MLTSRLLPVQTKYLEHMFLTGYWDAFWYTDHSMSWISLCGSHWSTSSCIWLCTEPNIFLLLLLHPCFLTVSQKKLCKKILKPNIYSGICCLTAKTWKEIHDVKNKRRLPAKTCDSRSVFYISLRKKEFFVRTKLKTWDTWCTQCHLNPLLDSLFFRFLRLETRKGWDKETCHYFPETEIQTNDRQSKG